MEFRKRTLSEKELKLINLDDKLSDEELFEKFINAKRLEGISERTIQLYKQTRKTMIRDLARRQQLKTMSELNKREVENLILWWLDEVAVATVNNRIRVLKVYYKTLKRLQYLKTDPMRNISQLKEKQPIKPTLSEPDIKKVINHLKREGTYANYRTLVTFILMLDTGLRVGEVASLQVSDLNENSLTIRETKSKMQRVVFPSQKCLQALNAYLKIREDMKSPYFFLTITGEPMALRSIQQSLERVGRAVGLKERLAPQMLRRTYAKHAIINGIDPFSLARLLGHESLNTTKRYVQIWGADLQKQSLKRGNFEQYF